jgi:integrase
MITWGMAQGLVDRNWLLELKRPSTRRRSTLIESYSHRTLIESVGTGIAASKADRHFRLVLAALRHPGGRPQDVAGVRIEHVDLERNQWVLPEHKTKRYTNHPRIIYLEPCLRTITLLAKGNRTSGPLFRNSLDQPLTVNAIRCRMRSLRRKNLLPAGAVAYS